MSSAFSYGFKVGDFNKDYPLIIDPLLASTFIGGGGTDDGWSIALDGSGNVYVTGLTTSADYPTEGVPYDNSHNSNSDVFVSKLNSTLSSLLVSTFIGGGNNEDGSSITLDGSGNVYVTGSAQSGYPTIGNPYDPSHNGGWDVFVSKLDSNLSAGPTSTTTTTVSPIATTIIPNTTTTVIPNTTTVNPVTTTSSSSTTTTTHVNGGTIIIYNYCKLCEAFLDVSVTSLLADYDYNSSGNISCFGCPAYFYDVSPGLISINYECHPGEEGEETTIYGGTTVLLFPRQTIELNYTCIVEEITKDFCPSLQIYGEHSEETELLRYYRDNVLSKTSEGQEIIKLYYEWGPVIVKMMEEDEEFKQEVKELIDEVLKLVREDRRIDPLLMNKVK